MILGFASLLTNFLLFLASLIIILVLSKQFKPEPEIQIKPECKFRITTPKFEIVGNKKYARYSVYVDNANKFFLDFPVMFKFYSDYKFKTKIRIAYIIPGDDEEELIYDKLLIFEEDTKEHIYYITDVILGSIDFEIELEVDYGRPIISFEILENNMCRLTEEYLIEIKFPCII